MPEAHFRLDSWSEMVQYQTIMDIVLQETVPALSYLYACLFSTEENGCDSSIFS